FLRMFDISNDSNLFETDLDLERDGWVRQGNMFLRGAANGHQMLPLYTGFMVTHYDHRAADAVVSHTAASRPNQPRYIPDHEKRMANRLAQPAYWVAQSEVDRRLDGRWD